MSMPVPPRDANAPQSLSAQPYTALGDEEALKNAFLAEYSSLSQEARADLGDAVGLAPKVVEGAFVRAWDARDKLKTAAELHEFLVADVHHAAARALSRKAAAHRFGAPVGHEVSHAVSGEMNAEQSWLHIQHALHGEEHSPGALAALAAASRHEAADHIGAVGKSSSAWLALVLAGVVIALAALGMWTVDRVAAKGRVAKAVNAQDARPITTPAGRAGTINLTDGTTAHMAPETKLLIPKDFGEKLRGVKLEGAATFDVAKGLPLPFEVYARNARLVATGTAFTVSAYPGDSVLTVVVSEGSVDVHQGDSVHTVAANGALVMQDDGTVHAPSVAEREEATSWTSGMLVVDNRPLQRALTLMKRWYGYDIRVPKPALLARPVSLRVSLDSGMQAIKLVEQSSGLEFGYVGQNMVYREPGAAKADKAAKKK
ncbi:MAG: FecR domain-containing protein [bacterium]